MKREFTFRTPLPEWTETDLSALPNWTGSEIIEFVVDAFSPKYLGAGAAVNGWIITGNLPVQTGTIFRITDIGGSPVVTPQKAIGVGAGRGINAQFERGVQNWGIVVVSSGGGTVVYYTTDGTNWTTVYVDAYYDTWGPTWFCGLALNPHTPGEAYISTLLATGSSHVTTPPSGVILKTTDYGASWVSTGLSVGYMKAGAIVMPYAAPDYLFHGYRTGSMASVYRLYRSRLSTGAQVDISPVVDGHVYGVEGVDGANKNRTNRQISLTDREPNDLLFVGTSVSAGKRAVFHTRNALAAAPKWEIIVEPVAVASCLYSGSYFVDTHYAILFGAAGNIAIFNGSAVFDRTGDLALGAGIVGLCGL